jgi:hypothetical protein
MFKSIPASNIAAVYPDVLGAGGNPLGLNTNVASDIAIYPSYEYTTASLVGQHFGLTSDEHKFAVVYFNGYTGASTRPQSLYFTKYNSNDVAAALIGGAVGLTLEQLKAVSGTLSVTIDGVVKSGTIDLSTATSFSNAADIIETALSIEFIYQASIKSFMSRSLTMGSASSISYFTGTAADELGLTEAKGAITVNDTAKDTPQTLANRMLSYASNFAVITRIGQSFDDAFDREFATWNSQQNGRYAYLTYDLDPLAIVPNNDSSFGAWAVANTSGVLPIYGTLDKLGIACGYAASLNFSEFNGRTTFAFRSQSGLIADVTSEDDANALVSNGYSFYGAWATANDRFQMLGNGAVTGEFKWFDNYLFQIFLNSQLQLAYMNMVQNYNSIPYNNDGVEIVRATCQDPINQGINFGGIRAGVELTSQQRDVINRATGYDASSQLLTRGWALYVALPDAQVRAQRGSFIIKLYYTDGSSLQRIEMTSTNVQ